MGPASRSDCGLKAVPGRPGGGGRMIRRVARPGRIIRRLRALMSVAGCRRGRQASSIRVQDRDRQGRALHVCVVPQSRQRDHGDA